MSHLCDSVTSHMIFSALHLSNNLKEKKRKRNINNDLAVLLSHDISDYPNSFLVVNLSGNSSLLNISSSHSCLVTSSMSHRYSFSNSLIASFAFFKFSLSSQASDFAVNPFQCTRYLFLPFTRCLFNILFTSHSSSLIITGAGCSFLCSSTCPTYRHILLTFTTGCIFTVLGSSNSTVFNNTIFLIL